MTIIIPTPLYLVAIVIWTCFCLGIGGLLATIALSGSLPLENPEPPKEPLTGDEKRKLKKLAAIDERWR